MLYMLINRKYLEKKKVEDVQECQMGGIFRQLFSLLCGMLWISGDSRDQFILFLYRTQKPKYPWKPGRNILDF